MARTGVIPKLDHLGGDTGVDALPVRPSRKPRAWQVIHACEYARDVTPVVDAQIAVGMSPFVVTSPTTSKKAAGETASLMQAWQQIRMWRKHLDESGSPFLTRHLRTIAIVHAHSFTAGMAAVRGQNPAVYDLRFFVEEAARSGQSGETSWLARSFRTAEQFVLTRAGAVVVHAASMRALCIGRGVAAENIFVVPDPVALFPETPAQDQGATWLHRVFSFAENEAVAVVTCVDSAASGLVQMLQAFAQAHAENEATKFFVVADSSAERVRSLAREFGLEHALFVIAPVDEARALASADIILDSRTEGATLAADRVSLTALLHGRALLAPDLPANRDLTPQGRGCLWYKPADSSSSNDNKDLAHCLAFLARNHDFRKALGESGRKYIIDTRAPQKIGQRYAEVYRHADHRRRHHSDSQDISASLIPTRACL
jgi:glycosyltransferase involved in cell wall biosynthesis